MNQTNVTMPDPRFEMLSASQVARLMNVGRTTAYVIIKKLNNELKEQGKITISGRISRAYFESKFYKS